MSSLRRVQNYISNVQPPKYPFADRLALAAAGRGRSTTAGCASCHATGGARTGTVIPLAEIGTDRHRLDMWTPASATAYNAYGEGHAWKFSAFRTTGGYVSVPLEGLWLRAPYLHNGSVPSLADLLEKTAQRPTRFWRGYDVYDPGAGRLRHERAGRRTLGTLIDVTQPETATTDTCTERTCRQPRSARSSST